MARRSAPEVNAGSTADIAFLLLIFFLVTTTLEKDNGIARQLPPIDKSEIEPPKIKEKNLFIVLVNKNDQLLVNDSPMELEDLRENAIEFLDNGGALSNSIEYCDYCKGKRLITSSDNPEKAIISLKNLRETSYAQYISVQNELVGAYNELRNKRALQLGPSSGFRDMNFIEMQKKYKDVKWPGNKTKLKEVIDRIKLEYPQKLSEVQEQ